MPPLEVWEKVQISTEFLDDQHGRLSCLFCHGGQDGIGTKEAAHAGMTRDPSDGDAAACVGCHQEIVQKHAASAHGTQQGYFTSFARRTGVSEASPELREMFEAACATCHTSCGQCHISRPTSAEGGFLHAHQIRRTPNQSYNCTACHGSRIGEEFQGQHQDEGLPADTHYLHLMNCFSCHTGDELHGDGTTPDTRYDVAAAPRCTDAGCHDGLSLTNDNEQHEEHLATVACQVCHSVAYKNCYRCHVGEGLETPSRLDFRIGKSPRQNEAHPWEWALLRHVPIATDSYTAWGVEQPRYADYPTWVYTSPHNIQKHTPQNASCEACHEDSTLWLTTDYVNSLIDEGVMEQAEIEANEAVMIHELPDWEER